MYLGNTTSNMYHNKVQRELPLLNIKQIERNTSRKRERLVNHCLFAIIFSSSVFISSAHLIPSVSTFFSHITHT